MMNAGRCGGGGRTVSGSSSSKDRRVVVNGGGNSIVNRCDKSLGLDHEGRKEMIMSKSLVACNEHYSDVCKEFSYPDSTEDLSLTNILLVQKLNSKCALLKNVINEKTDIIQKLTKELQFYKATVDNVDQDFKNEKRKTTRPSPCTQVPPTCPSEVSNSIITEAVLSDQPSVRTTRPKTHSAVNNKRPNPHPQEPVPRKKQRTRNSRNNKSLVSDANKKEEFSLLTEDHEYYTCLGNFDPERDDPIPGIKNSNLEIPSWRLKPFSSWYSMEGTENMSDDIFENRHSRLEECERKRKRWDLQRLRELKRVEYLKEGRYRNHLQNDKKEECTTLLPNPANIKAIEVTNNLPVSAFGVNLYTKKKSGPGRYYHSKYCHDGSRIPQESNVRNTRGLRSSGRNPLY